jgi:hypothetical protein
MISTHARMGSSLNSVALDSLPARTISTASKTPTSLGLSCSTDIALCFIQSNTCLCPPSHLISTTSGTLVGVLKGKIKRWAQHEADIYDPAMFKASTWQRVVESSLQELMAGAQPRTQVCEGVHSQVRNCVKIVAADEDQLVQCQHTQGLHTKPPCARARRQLQLHRMSWSPPSLRSGTAGRWPLPATVSESLRRNHEERGPALVHCVHSGEAHDCVHVKPRFCNSHLVPQLISICLLICSPEIRSKRLFVQTPVPKSMQPTSNSANQQDKPSLQQLFMSSEVPQAETALRLCFASRSDLLQWPPGSCQPLELFEVQRHRVRMRT